MKVEIWNGHLDLTIDAPLPSDEVCAIDDLFGYDIDCVEMYFNGKVVNPRDIKDANGIAEFLIRHRISGERATDLTKMIESYSDFMNLTLSETIELYENEEIESEVLETFDLKYGD